MSRRRRKREIAQQPGFPWALTHGAIPADPSRQARNNSYSPPEYYVDITFTCRDCGAREVWTAAQQQWYYEVAKGSIYATAVRCRDCRRKRHERHQGQGDPYPIKHVGPLLKHIRAHLEPLLLEKGFTYEGGRESPRSRRTSINYSRADTMFCCRLDGREGCLVAEIVDDQLVYTAIRSLKISALPWPTPELSEQEFNSPVGEFIRKLPSGQERR